MGGLGGLGGWLALNDAKLFLFIRPFKQISARKVAPPQRPRRYGEMQSRTRVFIGVCLRQIAEKTTEQTSPKKPSRNTNNPLERSHLALFFFFGK